jgi:hypothetical protein
MTSDRESGSLTSEEKAGRERKDLFTPFRNNGLDFGSLVQIVNVVSHNGNSQQTNAAM